MSLSPILVFCYNRPWHVEKTLQALSKNELAEQSELFVFCDGPKKDASDDQLKKIEETRHVVKKKQWCKDVHIIESDINKGLRSSIISGVDQVIRQFGKVIVLEDDLETSPYFLKYMNAALSKYQDYGGVFSISAQSYVNPNDFPKDYPYDVYAFSTHLPTGWATWIDRWNVVNWDIDKQLAEQFEKEPYMRDAFMRGGEDRFTDDGLGFLFADGQEGVEITKDSYFEHWMTQPLSMLFRMSDFNYNWQKKYQHYRDTFEIYHLLKEGKGWLFSFEGGVYNLHENGISSLIDNEKQFGISYKVSKELYEVNKDSFTKKNYVNNLRWLIGVYANTSDVSWTSMIWQYLFLTWDLKFVLKRVLKKIK